MPEAYLRRDPSRSIDDQVGWTEEDKNKMRDFDLGRWLQSHPFEKVEKLLKEWVSAIKGKSGDLLTFGTGYCFGGRYVLRLAGSSNVDAAASFHPVSLLFSMNIQPS